MKTHHAGPWVKDGLHGGPIAPVAALGGSLQLPIGALPDGRLHLGVHGELPHVPMVLLPIPGLHDARPCLAGRLLQARTQRICQADCHHRRQALSWGRVGKRQAEFYISGDKDLSFPVAAEVRLYVPQLARPHMTGSQHLVMIVAMMHKR